MQTPNDGEELSNNAQGTQKAAGCCFATTPDPSISHSPCTSQQQDLHIGRCHSPRSAHTCEPIRRQPPPSQPPIDSLIVQSQEQDDHSSITPTPGVKKNKEATPSVPNSLQPSDNDNVMLVSAFEFQGLEQVLLMTTADPSRHQRCSSDGELSLSTLTSIDSLSVADSLHAGYLKKSLRLRSPVVVAAAAAAAAAAAVDGDDNKRRPCPDTSRAA